MYDCNVKVSYEGVTDAARMTAPPTNTVPKAKNNTLGNQPLKFSSLRWWWLWWW